MTFWDIDYIMLEKGGIMKYLSYLIVFLMIGCATIIRGTKQNVAVKTIPTGATVIVKGMEKGITPTILNLPRGEDVVIRFEKEGYKPVKVMLTKELDLGCVVGSALFTGLIGIVIDFASGSVYRLTPPEVNAMLEKIEEQGINLKDLQQKGEITIIAVDMEDINK